MKIISHIFRNIKRYFRRLFYKKYIVNIGNLDVDMLKEALDNANTKINILLRENRLFGEYEFVMKERFKKNYADKINTTKIAYKILDVFFDKNDKLKIIIDDREFRYKLLFYRHRNTSKIFVPRVLLGYSSEKSNLTIIDFITIDIKFVEII